MQETSTKAENKVQRQLFSADKTQHRNLGEALGAAEVEALVVKGREKKALFVYVKCRFCQCEQSKKITEKTTGGFYAPKSNVCDK